MYRTKTRKAVTTYVSDKTIEKIIKLLRCAFKQAVRWEIIARNPFDNVILPMPSAELEKAVNERGISSRTMRTAKSRIGDRLVTEKDGTAWVCYLRD